jgi:Zincin-like metallopeptidase
MGDGSPCGLRVVSRTASRHRGGREATGIRHGGARAFYAEGPDYVQMPPFESFHDAESHAATLAHELTHWTKHGKRLAREFGRQRWGDAGYAAEELVASLGRLSSVPISRSRPSRAPITPATSRHGGSF